TFWRCRCGIPTSSLSTLSFCYWPPTSPCTLSLHDALPILITDPTELHQFTAFVTWAAWASVTNRPGENYSYTNNLPYDPAVGNRSEEHTSELQSREKLVCRLLLEKKSQNFLNHQRIIH